MKIAFAPAFTAGCLALMMMTKPPMASAHRHGCGKKSMKGRKGKGAGCPTKRPAKKPTRRPTRAPTSAPTRLCPNVPFPVAEYNGHIYSVVTAEPPIVWTVANAMVPNLSCCGESAHLATMADTTERDFIFGLVGSSGTFPAWFGAADLAGNETLGWTTGEPYDPTVVGVTPPFPGLDFGSINFEAGAPYVGFDSSSTVCAAAVIEFDCPIN